MKLSLFLDKKRSNEVTHTVNIPVHRKEKERHTVVIMDGPGWHTEDYIDGLANASLVKLPLYSSVLNPIEQV
ncbi:transposase [Photobacterium sagamiensis]|uniref:transposase n=1 Tax=Photobacterium sagamiensis TaxID=2910241 RepID=UPI003D108E4B